MSVGWAAAFLAPSIGLLVGGVLLSGGRRRGLGEILVAIAGAGLGAAALFLQRDVSPSAWVAAPVILAGLTVAHVRALFAGAGPLRS